MFKKTLISCLAFALFAVPDADAQGRKKNKKKKGSPNSKGVSAVSGLATFNPTSFKEAVNYLSRRYRSKYPNGAEFLKKIAEIEKQFPALKARLAKGGSAEDKAAFKAITDLQKKALVTENPQFNFNELLFVKRKPNAKQKKYKLGFPNNWMGNNIVRPGGYENEIVKLDLRKPNAQFQTVYRPKKDAWVGDIDIHWDNSKMMFSSQSMDNNTWQIIETDINGKNARQLTPNDGADVDNYDPVYLPDGRIIYSSTACYNAVPCVNGKVYVANFHLMNPDGSNNRRITFDQDNDWYPVVKNDGMVMYVRWEYTDSAHYFSRILLQMNPDGSGQRSMYGSNSYWPTAMFYVRPVPGSNSKFIAVVSGHHGVQREGELVLFDTNKGTKETEGVVQRVGGIDKNVKGEVLDQYAKNIWPRYIHPYPISEKFYLTAGLMSSAQNGHGIYMVDTFGNVVEVAKADGYSLLEPMPLMKRKRPPVIPDRVDPSKKEGTIYVADIYQGPGLRGVPRGEVKKVRIFEYEYAYRNTGGHYKIGMEGCWDVRRVLGEVNVHEDGSFMVKVPANRPLAIQPLDKDGNAMQQMRSWLTVMPGEVLACVGCHEDINHAVPTKRNIASTKPAQTLNGWYGPNRGFSFLREIQPVLDRKCVGCHDGKDKKLPDFSRQPKSKWIKISSAGFSYFAPSYMNLHPYVRRNGPEGDYTLLMPNEFHVSTSRLTQMLKKGHHNVQLTAEEMKRFNMWIDLNVPFHGTWTETGNVRDGYVDRRMELRKKYGNVDVDIETIDVTNSKPEKFQAPPKAPKRKKQNLKVAGWPMANPKAGKTISVDLGGGEKIELVQIPAGKFVMGSEVGNADEYPTSVVAIDQPFYMQTKEITLAQMQQFMRGYKNGYYDMHYKDQLRPGYNMDADKQFPAIRVSWKMAMDFCKWLSEKTGKKVTLPTEAQWEWAARAGSDNDFFYGDINTDFSKVANLADAQLINYAVKGVDPKPFKNPNQWWDYEPKDKRFDDGTFHLAKVGSYKPNAFGLYDMIGNVAEWTRDTYKPYPYSPSKVEAKGKKVLRGGSWYDRPILARSSYRIEYPYWMRVFNSGFRVIIEE